MVYGLECSQHIEPVLGCQKTGSGVPQQALTTDQSKRDGMAGTSEW